jgi:pyridoxamine 5'-phosphate oxidase
MDEWIDGLGSDPHAVLARWLAEARAAELFEPEAAALATATADGRPSARMVLVRGVDEGDLRFYTNHESRKAAELAANPHSALVFHWGPPLRRQARIEGTVTRLGEDEAVAYFETRDRESRIGAWASPQSRPLASRSELELRVADAEARFAGESEVALPPFWGGYRVVADAVELWQNRPSRLHDRVRFERSTTGWRRTRLAP